MLHFFYDSLDTLKKVKKPTWKEIRVFTIQVFVVVLVSAFIFFLLDNLRGSLYRQIFESFGTPRTSVVAPAANIEIPTVNPVVPAEELPSAEVPVEVVPAVATGA